MTSKQRAYLKSLAAPLEATLQIGKLGLTPEVTQAVREAFNTRELLKITMLRPVWMISGRRPISFPREPAPR